VVALQITPFVAWVPLAVIWFGATERAVVFVAIVGSFPSMALATLQAIRQVPPLYERAGRTLGARGWSLYRKIIVPAALPGMMAGLQQAWGFAWKALMAGELIVAAAHAGLGHLLDPAPRCERPDPVRCARGHRRDRGRGRLPAVRPARPEDPSPARAADRGLTGAFPSTLERVLRRQQLDPNGRREVAEPLAVAREPTTNP
jgi:ABC-type nitrate/sulfonate/bicarbonate transport system, permease component